MNMPKLIIMPSGPNVRWNRETIEAIKDRVRAFAEDGQTTLIFSEQVNIYQLVNGRWEAIPNAPGEPVELARGVEA